MFRTSSAALFATILGIVFPLWASAQVLRPTNDIAGHSPLSIQPVADMEPLVREIYDASGWQALWVNTGGPGAADVALGAFLAAADHGLDPETYDYLTLRKRTRGLKRDTLQLLQELAGLELELTKNIVRLARDLRPSEKDPSVLREAILRGARNGSLDEALNSLAPQHRQYARLKQVLRRYEGAAEFGRSAIGQGPTLQLGSRGPRVLAVREVLGAARSSRSDDVVFDLDLEYQVREYQRRHGLDPDGRVGSATRRHMDTGLLERVAQIRINLERWRNLSIGMDEKHLQVNIPNYRLSLVDQGEEQLSMRVVVGKRRNQTPVFADQIEYVVLNPYWYVPRRIALRELLPKIEEDPDYLARNGFEILRDGMTIDPEGIDWAAEREQGFPFRLRQRPGPNNSLGQVKFMLPNERSIYLHDTPADGLFNRSRRAFSHGCVRVEHPVLLAEALLGVDRDWGTRQIDSVLKDGKRRQVNLRTPVPVFITYFSVVVDEEGKPSFFEDVYKRDPVAVEKYRFARTRPAHGSAGQALVAASP